VRRIARGQLDMSIERLEGDTDEDLATAVHETRAFRDAGRRLAGARDSQVLLETLDALTDRYFR
jgi:hypothetical protein